MAEERSGRGGARKGAGRKKGSAGPQKKKLQVVLPAHLVDKLEEITATQGTPKSWVVTKALEAYLKS